MDGEKKKLLLLKVGLNFSSMHLPSTNMPWSLPLKQPNFGIKLKLPTRLDSNS